MEGNFPLDASSWPMKPNQSLPFCSNDLVISSSSLAETNLEERHLEAEAIRMAAYSRHRHPRPRHEESIREPNRGAFFTCLFFCEGSTLEGQEAKPLGGGISSLLAIM